MNTENDIIQENSPARTPLMPEWSWQDEVIKVSGNSITIDDVLTDTWRTSSDRSEAFKEEKDKLLASIPTQTLIEAMMKKGFGLLIQCGRPGLAERAIALAEATGRGKDVRVMRIGGDVTYNFVEALEKKGPEAIARGLKRGNKSWDEWNQAADEHLSNIVSLFILAGEKVDIAKLSLALNDIAIHKNLLQAAGDKIPAGSPDEHTLLMFCHYFLKQWAAMGDKTKERVIMALTPILNPFCTGYMRELFCKGSTFDPIELRDGKILIVDIPCDDYKGAMVSQVMKYMTQKMIEENRANKATRPVVIIHDDVESREDIDFARVSHNMKGGILKYTDI